MQAEAVGHRVPDGAALEEVEGANTFGQLLNRLGAQDPHRVDDVLDLRASATRQVVGDAHDGDHKRDVRLDGLDDLGDRNSMTADQREQPVARLGERGKAFKSVERGGQAPSVAFTWPLVNRLSGRPSGGPSRNGLVC